VQYLAPQRLLNRFRKSEPDFATRKLVAPLGEPFVGVLGSMYDGEPQLGANGKLYPLDAVTRIPPSQGMWMYRLVRDTKPEDTLEIGLAFGFSTVYILAAIQSNGRGHHLALDPYEEILWHGIGRMREKVLNMKPEVFSFSNEDSIQGLTRLAREGKRFGVIFIDGNHRFDDALIDFSLASVVCEPGGYIIIDDLWMPSIKRVVSFIRRNRLDFTEVPTPISRMVVFRKTDSDKRAWNHFVRF
jgi:predicted O-methyltransferase YrrM